MEGRLTVDESRFTGIVGHQVIAFYMRMGDLRIFLFTIIAFASVTWTSISIEWWAGKWFNRDFQLTDQQSIRIYFGLVIALFVFLIARSLLYSTFAPKASYSIYKKLLWNLLRKPMTFFDTNPSGVIINRAVDDMETVELEFPKTVYIFLDLFLV